MQNSNVADLIPRLEKTDQAVRFPSPSSSKWRLPGRHLRPGVTDWEQAEEIHILEMYPVGDERREQTQEGY